MEKITTPEGVAEPLATEDKTRLVWNKIAHHLDEASIRLNRLSHESSSVGKVNLSHHAYAVAMLVGSTAHWLYPKDYIKRHQVVSAIMDNATNNHLGPGSLLLSTDVEDMEHQP